MARLRHYKRPPMVGLAVAALGALALSLDPVALPLPLVELLLALVGAGIGTVLPVTTVSIQNAVPMHQLGTATGAMSFFRSLGGAIAVAGFGAILLRGIPVAGNVHAGLEPLPGSRQRPWPSSFTSCSCAAAVGFAPASPA